jgi:hypothetical protein
MADKPKTLIALSRLSVRDRLPDEPRYIERGQSFDTDLRTEKDVQRLINSGAVALPDSDEGKTAVEDYEVAQRLVARRAQIEAARTAQAQPAKRAAKKEA